MIRYKQLPKKDNNALDHFLYNLQQDMFKLHTPTSKLPGNYQITG